MVVSGKPELNKSGWLKNEHMAEAAKLKKACSNSFYAASGTANVGIMYTSTAITVLRAFIYCESAVTGTTGAIDVGINGDDDCIVNAQALPATAIDGMVECTIANGAVAAGKFLTSSVETAVGTAGNICVGIEYTEDN